MTTLGRTVKLVSIWLARVLFCGGLAYLLRVMFLVGLTGCAYYPLRTGRAKALAQAGWGTQPVGLDFLQA
jgi:hypothetical protein